MWLLWADTLEFHPRVIHTGQHVTAPSALSMALALAQQRHKHHTEPAKSMSSSQPKQPGLGEGPLVTTVSDSNNSAFVAAAANNTTLGVHSARTDMTVDSDVTDMEAVEQLGEDPQLLGRGNRMLKMSAWTRFREHIRAQGKLFSCPNCGLKTPASQERFHVMVRCLL